MKISIGMQSAGRGLEDVHYLGSHTLEGFRVLNTGSPGNTARVVGAVLRDIRLVLVQVALRSHSLHGLQLERKHCGDIDKRGGDESALHAPAVLPVFYHSRCVATCLWHKK